MGGSGARSLFAWSKLKIMMTFLIFQHPAVAGMNYPVRMIDGPVVFF
jgi:hypothetical protein